MPRSSATAASTSVVLGNAPRLSLMGSPHRPHRSFSSVHCRASITALSSSLERVRDRTGRAEGFCEVVLVWLRLKLGATDRICEQTTNKQGRNPT